MSSPDLITKSPVRPGTKAAGSSCRSLLLTPIRYRVENSRRSRRLSELAATDRASDRRASPDETSASSLGLMIDHVSSRGCRREDNTCRSLRCRLRVPRVRCALEGDSDPAGRGHDRMAVESGRITAHGDRVLRMRRVCAANALAFRGRRRCTRPATTTQTIGC
jgi:hypothetical protein